MASYKVLQGLEYGDKRAEIGDVVSDVPSKSIKWLLEQGVIELVESKKTAAAVEPEETPEEDGE